MRRRLTFCSLALASGLLLSAACSWTLDGFTSGGPQTPSPDASGGGPTGVDGDSPRPPDASFDAAATERIAFVQANAHFEPGNQPVTLSFPADVGAGHTILAAATHDSDGTVMVGAAGGQVLFAPVAGPTSNAGGRSSLWAAYNVPGGSAVVTAVVGGGSTPPTYLLVYILEYAGVTGLDVATTNSGTSTSPDGATANLTTTGPNELLVAYAFSKTSAAAGTGFAARSTVSQNVVEDRLLDVAGAATATATSGSGGWEILAAAFHGP